MNMKEQGTYVLSRLFQTIISYCCDGGRKPDINSPNGEYVPKARSFELCLLAHYENLAKY